MKLENEFALVGATLIDGNGGPPRRDVTIMVKDGVIQKVAAGKRGVKSGPRLQRVDLDGRFVMPGLIDSHLHFTGTASDDPVTWLSEPNYLRAIRTVAQAHKVLDFGFTTVRCCGSRCDVYLRQAIEEGTVAGPRIVACGLGICRTGGHGDIRRDIYQVSDEVLNETHPWAQRCDGVEEIRKAVRRLINQGVDFIKFWMSGGDAWEKDRNDDVHFTPEEAGAIVQEAHMCRLKVAAHCENIRAIKAAIEVGVDTIEHADMIAGAPGLDEETCRRLVKKNIIIVPTLSVYFVGAWAVKALPQNVVDSYKLAIKSGVKLALGTDAFADRVTPYGQYNAGELKLMTDILGLTPMQAIVSATKVGAEAVGLQDRVGTVEEGKLADLLVLKGNPAEDIAVLLDRDNIEHVIKQGKLVR
ncbi:MAG: amidohydrolase family protein [Chloroflexi bacterium]|nr:amidohydrolase family protein [Chloroflexota bacterium]